MPDSNSVVTVYETRIEVTVVDSENTVIVDQSEGTSVIEVGIVGPAGPADGDTVYAERIDTVGSVIYKAWAVPTATLAETDSLWRIQKIEITGDDISKKFANGLDTFVNRWDQRLSLTYT